MLFFAGSGGCLWMRTLWVFVNACQAAQAIPPCSCRSSASSACASSSLVAHLIGFCHRSATVQRQLYHPDGGRSVQQDGPFCAPGQTPAPPHHLSPRHPGGRGLRWGSSMFWRVLCSLLGATVSLSSGYHPQSNSQTKHKNQEMCLTSQHPSSWSEQLVWVEYAHNTLTSSATGLSPFECAYGFQPPLFPALEKEASCPSVQAFIRRCHRTRAALLQAVGRYSECLALNP